MRPQKKDCLEVGLTGENPARKTCRCTKIESGVRLRLAEYAEVFVYYFWPHMKRVGERRA